MALYKQLELSNGVVTSYHRIVSLNIITNAQNIIEVASYTSQQKRQEQLEAIQNGAGYNVFIKTEYFSAGYDQSMDIAKAYEFLKSTSVFKNSQDI